jgi:hypothetical protein
MKVKKPFQSCCWRSRRIRKVDAVNAAHEQRAKALAGGPNYFSRPSNLPPSGTDGPNRTTRSSEITPKPDMLRTYQNRRE